MSTRCDHSPTCSHSARFLNATIRLRHLGVKRADITLTGGAWSMTCTVSGRTVEAAGQPTEVDAVEQLVAAVKRALTSAPGFP